MSALVETGFRPAEDPLPLPRGELSACGLSLWLSPAKPRQTPPMNDPAWARVLPANDACSSNLYRAEACSACSSAARDRKSRSGPGISSRNVLTPPANSAMKLLQCAAFRDAFQSSRGRAIVLFVEA